MNRDHIESSVTVLAMFVVMAVSSTFPAISAFVWTMFWLCVLARTVAGISKPVNYHAIEMTEDGFHFYRYEGWSESARWDEIRDIRFSRSCEDFSKSNQTEWLIDTADGRHITVLVEFMHRKRFGRALARHVPGFLVAPARAGIASRKTGLWQCYAPAGGQK